MIDINNSQTELVSIIVPVYNTAECLPRCVRSIQNQTYRNIELILVDDGSTDNSLEICRQFAATDDRIAVYHKENGGQSSARNLGMQYAKGKYYAFVDSDDWVTADFLEVLYDLLQKYSADISVVNYVKTYQFTETDIEDDSVTEEVWQRDKAVKYFIEQTESNVAVWNKLYRKEIVSGCEFPEGQYYEEYYFQLNVLKNVKTVASTSKRKYFYFQRANSTVHSKTPKKELDNIRTFYTCLPIVREFYPYEENYCLQSLIEHYYFFIASRRFSMEERQQNVEFLENVQNIIGDPHKAIMKSSNPFSNIFYTYQYHYNDLTHSEKNLLQRDYRKCWRNKQFKNRNSLSYMVGFLSLEIAVKLKRL